MNIRARRMDTEWQLLDALAAENRATLVAVTRSADEFRIVMQESPAWVVEKKDRRTLTEHVLRYVYPRYYPSLPLEGYFVRPISHVNVDPVTGFVCLWQDYRPTQTIVDAILITRAIMAGKVANLNPVHRMQQDAVLENSEICSLSMPPLTIPASCRPPLSHRYAGSRRRLTSGLNDQLTGESDCAFSDTE